MVWGFQTFNSYFILLGIIDHSSTHIFFSLVLGISAVAMMGNTLVVLFLYLDTQLHTTMYFLLSQLSLMDLVFISTTGPKMAFNYLSGSKPITIADCATHIFFYTSLTGCECFLLAVMAYDCYVATCHPLRYTSFMRPKICALRASSSWILGSTDGVIDAVVTFSFSSCGSWVIAHFFCDFPFLLVIQCTDSSIFEEVLFHCCIIMIFFPCSNHHCLLCLSSSDCHSHESGKGRHRAFGTCSSYLMVVGMYYGAILFMHMRPTSNHSPTQDRMMSVFYTILTPTLNPLIYSFHNKEVACAFQKGFQEG